MSNSHYDDVFTVTLENRTKSLADNVSKNNALLKRLNEKGKIRKISGGSKILEELEYGEGDLVWYTGYDNITYTPKQLFTAAEFGLKLCAVPVAISGEDLLKNSGEGRMMDLFEKRVENAAKTMKIRCQKRFTVMVPVLPARKSAVCSFWWLMRRQPVRSAVLTVLLPEMNFGAISQRLQLPH